MTSRPGVPEAFTIHWPEPAHLRLEMPEGASEACEIQFNDGTIEEGDLLRFTGRDEHLVFRPFPGHPRYPSKIVVRTSRFKRLRLKQLVSMRPLDAGFFGANEGLITPAQVHVYNVEFTDHEIESGDTMGYVRNAIGLFLFFNRPGDLLERVFIPNGAIAYFQAGDPIGRLLVEENAVSEEQLKVAVEKQQEMRKLVLGDYLIDEGLINPQQLEAALAHQKTKPSLRLGEALIELGAVQPEALQIALARQRANRGRPLGQILVDMGVVDAATLNKIHAKKLGRPFVSLASFTPSDEAIGALSAGTVRRLGVLPLSIEHGDLIVASESPLDSAAINELTLSARMRVVQVLAPGPEIQALRALLYGNQHEGEFARAAAAEVHFEGIEVIEAHVPDDETEADDEVEDVHFTERNAGVTDPHLLTAIDRAIAAVELGGTVDIRIEVSGATRRTHIQFRRG